MTDNMKLWDAVSKTNPGNTKKVNQRGGFTAIAAHSQIMEATRQFGPIGIGWGYDTGEFQLIGPLVVVPVTLWHGERDNTFGPILGCAEMLGARPDHDAPKKATTDAITKGLSQLGFNADVFLGMFDDNKYVEQMKREFADAPLEPKPDPERPARTKLEGPYTSTTALKAAYQQLDRDIRASESVDDLDGMLELPKNAALIEQLKRDAKGYVFGSNKLPSEHVPLMALISQVRTQLEAISAEGEAMVSAYRAG